jgi:glycosyltransferase involved in cell wall biosynthesis
MDIRGTMSTDTITIDRSKHPDVALPVDYEFAGVYADAVCEGALVAARSKVCIVGLARNIGGILPVSISRIEETVRHFAAWKAVVFENDSEDDTKAVLSQWAADDPEHVVVQLVNNGRPHLHGFEQARVVAMADYRNRCREMVREHMPDADYVIVLDLDAWGGWSVHGIINGIGWHSRIPKAACMASTSLFKHRGTLIDGKAPWAHYDNWAYRWLGWATRIGPWFTFWLPPPGAPPIEVNSAFGGCGIYKTQPYLEAEYSGDNGDCEHVNFHRTMKNKGWTIYLNPAQRCVMTWLADEDEEPSDGGQHRDHQR